MTFLLINTGERVAPKQVIRRLSESLEKQLLRSREIDLISPHHGEANEHDDVLRILFENCLKLLGRFVQLTRVGERIGQPDARVEVCGDFFQSALIHFGHFVETLLGPKKLHEHFTNFRLPRLDAE